ncbi:putative holin [Pseudodesulfovibrio indicus]|uniref:Holin n=1 Tax=Pseudodesulfovibrio indicus TaxID=1716143 RepID=A0A140D8W9_9BACT|nr:putative holin [Pseudodesulfovibrio indicus]AMK09636.1 hypothetical protein AWY79_00185 [Pseudodesulfovibrio indicus]TDT86415.1 putative holin [Pseudodesulfovibrio indicus]
MRTPRMTKTATLALALLCLVALISPQQLGVIAYKVALVLLAGVAGYILDRALFPYARPHILSPDPVNPREMSGDALRFDLWDTLYITAQIRRAVIVAAAMLAVGLGL